VTEAKAEGTIKMKKFFPYILTFVLITAILLISNLSELNSFNYKDGEYYRKYTEMDEEQIYQELMEHDVEYILSEMKSLENEIGTSDTSIFIPFGQALIDKESLISTQEIIGLLVSEEPGEALETVLIQMYIDKRGGRQELIQLLDENISGQAKYDIVAKSEFSEEELLDLYELRSDSFVYPLMIRMHSKLPEHQFYEKGMNLLMQPRSKKETEAILWHTPDLYKYAHKSGDEEACREIEERMYEIYDDEVDEVLRRNIIKNLAAMENMNIIRRIIDNERLKDAHFGAVLSALPYFLQVLEQPADPADLNTILDAMMICPSKEIGDAIQNSQFIEKTDHVMDVLTYIQENGEYLCTELSD
jgi:hypothetical protein